MTQTLSQVVVQVTPQMAKEWLERANSHGFNRRLKRRAVERYAADMRAGRWQLNGEPIIFGDAGGGDVLLLDGQHRLHAVVRAGVTVAMAVTRGVDVDAFLTIDSGVVRGPGDVMSILGERDPQTLSTALACVGNFRAHGTPYYGTPPTKSELEELLQTLPKIRDSVRVARANRTRLLSPAVVAFAHFVFSKDDRRDEAKATEFVELLGCGSGLEEGHPVLLLRQRLIDQRGAANKLDRRAVVYLLFRAWNGFRRGERLRLLKVPAFEGCAPTLPKVL